MWKSSIVVVKALIFTVLVPGSVTVAIPYSLLSSRAIVSPGGPRLIGALPIILGAAIYFRCAWDFAFAGLGTPAPIDPPRTLVAKGLYRVVRNPMYIGVLLILFGESLLLASFTILRYALLATLFFHLFVVFYEEPTLQKKFGNSYQHYYRTVPGWLPRRIIQKRKE